MLSFQPHSFEAVADDELLVVSDMEAANRMFGGQEDDRLGVGHVVNRRAILRPTFDIEAE